MEVYNGEQDTALSSNSSEVSRKDKGNREITVEFLLTRFISKYCVF